MILASHCVRCGVMMFVNTYNWGNVVPQPRDWIPLLDARRGEDVDDGP
jgi:hypothetical protein